MLLNPEQMQSESLEALPHRSAFLPVESDEWSRFREATRQDAAQRDGATGANPTQAFQPVLLRCHRSEHPPESTEGRGPPLPKYRAMLEYPALLRLAPLTGPEANRLALRHMKTEEYSPAWQREQGKYSGNTNRWSLPLRRTARRISYPGCREPAKQMPGSSNTAIDLLSASMMPRRICTDSMPVIDPMSFEAIDPYR